MSRIIFSLIFGICACASVNFADAVEGNQHELAPGYTYTLDRSGMTIDGRDFNVVNPVVNANCGYTAIGLTREDVASALTYKKDAIKNDATLRRVFALVASEDLNAELTDNNFGELFDRLTDGHIRGGQLMSDTLLSLVGHVYGMRISIYSNMWDGAIVVGNEKGEDAYVYFDYHRRHWMGLN